MSSTERWVNNDGLNVAFGSEAGVSSKEGRLSTMGDTHTMITKITGTDLGSADALVSPQPLVGIPTGAHIVSATLYVTTAFTSGGSATLTMGLWNDDGDGTYSVYDADGIDATIALTAIDAIGDHVLCDGAKVGSGSGVLAGTGSRDLYVSALYATAAFTAGEAELAIVYR